MILGPTRRFDQLILVGLIESVDETNVTALFKHGGNDHIGIDSFAEEERKHLVVGAKISRSKYREYSPGGQLTSYCIYRLCKPQYFYTEPALDYMSSLASDQKTAITTGIEKAIEKMQEDNNDIAVCMIRVFVLTLIPTGCQRQNIILWERSDA